MHTLTDLVTAYNWAEIKYDQLTRLGARGRDELKVIKAELDIARKRKEKIKNAMDEAIEKFIDELP